MGAENTYTIELTESELRGVLSSIVYHQEGMKPDAELMARLGGVMDTLIHQKNVQDERR